MLFGLRQSKPLGRLAQRTGSLLVPTANARSFATAMNVFNENVKTMQRQRAALRPDSEDFNYLRDEMARRVVDRLAFVNKSFPVIADVGCASGSVARVLAERRTAAALATPEQKAADEALLAKIRFVPGQEEYQPTEEESASLMRIFGSYSVPGVREVLQLDPASAHVARAHTAVTQRLSPLVSPPAQRSGLGALLGKLSGPAPVPEPLALDVEQLSTPALAADFNTLLSPTLATESVAGTPVPGDDAAPFNLYSATAPLDKLPLRKNSANLITSVLSAHWVNDLPAFFKAVFDGLAPDGVFIGAMFGGESLRELRSALAIADLERNGGVMPHMSPLTRAKDIGDIMKAVGYSLLTVDVETVDVHYPDTFTLLEHLHAMGEQHAPQVGLGGPVSRDVFLAAAAAYDHLYRDPANDLLLASVDVVMMIGWKPHETQPKSLARGSAKYKMSDPLPEVPPALETTSVKTRPPTE